MVLSQPYLQSKFESLLAFHADSEGQSAPPTRAPPYQVRTHSVPNTQEYSLLRAKKKERESGGM